MKKKRKIDPPYRPRRAKRSTSRFSTANLLRLMQVHGSPSEKTVAISSLSSPVLLHSTQSRILTPSQYKPSTPAKGPLTSSVITPTQQTQLHPSRTLHCDDGIVSIFIAEDKAKEHALEIPAANKWVQKRSRVPKASMEGKHNIEIKKPSAKSSKHRSRSQKRVMTISAERALRKSGVSVPEKTAQWVHFIPYQFLKEASQTVDNLGLGLKSPNGAMELVNRALSAIFNHPQAPKKLYLSAIPEWVENFENIRLLKNLTYTVKSSLNDDAKSVSITFNMLNLSRVCETEIQLVQQVLEKKFLLAPPIASSEQNISEQNIPKTAFMPKKLSF